MKYHHETLAIIFWILLTMVVIHRHQLLCFANVQHMLRIFDVTDKCDIPNTRKFITDVRWFRKRYRQYVSLNFTFDKSTEINAIVLRFIRCQDLEMGCEDFQSWNFTNFCSSVRLRNPLWSEVVDSVRPKNWLKDCPRFTQEFYRYENASVDVNTLITFYKDVVKYHWKIYGYLYNRKNHLLYCGLTHFRFISFVAKEESH